MRKVIGTFLLKNQRIKDNHIFAVRIVKMKTIDHPKILEKPQKNTKQSASPPTSPTNIIKNMLHCFSTKVFCKNRREKAYYKCDMCKSCSKLEGPCKICSSLSKHRAFVSKRQISAVEYKEYKLEQEQLKARGPRLFHDNGRQTTLGQYHYQCAPFLGMPFEYYY